MFATVPSDVIVATMPLPEMVTVPTVAVVVAESVVKILTPNVHWINPELSSAPVALVV